MAGEGADFLPAFHVPEVEGLLSAARYHGLAVGRKGDRVRLPPRVLKLADLPAGIISDGDSDFPVPGRRPADQTQCVRTFPEWQVVESCLDHTLWGDRNLSLIKEGLGHLRHFHLDVDGRVRCVSGDSDNIGQFAAGFTG